MYKKILVMTLALMVTACAPHRNENCQGSTLKHCEPVVRFRFNATELDSEGKKKLTWTVEKLKRWPDRTVVLTGYADLWGGIEVNKRISLKRAESVKDYLVKQGISSDRIQVAAMGKQEPLSTKRVEQYMNRRVEVKFGHKDRLFFLNPDRLCEDCCSDS
ncbi:MAG: OmpA family protein [Alphaproteobacteria bacterium]|nr:OmpA family protein [Alphaproteobacteria bacterium]